MNSFANFRKFCGVSGWCSAPGGRPPSVFPIIEILGRLSTSEYFHSYSIDSSGNFNLFFWWPWASGWIGIYWHTSKTHLMHSNKQIILYQLYGVKQFFWVNHACLVFPCSKNCGQFSRFEGYICVPMLQYAGMRNSFPKLLLYNLLPRIEVLSNLSLKFKFQNWRISCFESYSWIY